MIKHLLENDYIDHSIIFPVLHYCADEIYLVHILIDNIINDKEYIRFALEIVIREGHKYIIDYIKKHNLNFELMMDTLFSFSKKYRRHDQIISFLNYGFKPSAPEKILFKMIKQEEIDLIKALLQNGVDVHVKKDEALIIATNGYNLEVLQILVENGAYVNARRGSPLRSLLSNFRLKYNKKKIIPFIRYLVDKGAWLDPKIAERIRDKVGDEVNELLNKAVRRYPRKYR